MVADSNIAQAISPLEALRRVGVAGLVAAALGGVKLVTGLGIPCPFRWATGWLCPLCGGTHVAVALMTGDLAGAWRANPLLLVAAAAVAARSVGWVVESVRGRKVSGHWVPAVARRHAVVLALVSGVGYVLVRNLA